ncbi:MAG: DUF2851 family protein [FCB group bacterium]|nr:DUF2851 family protein [FCB group bacterium]
MQYQSVETQNHPITLRISEEANLYPLWRNQRGNTFHTTQGPVTIVDPGVLNPYSGPDFKNAVIRFETGVIRRGDVEIHQHSHGWIRHHHKNDPAFADVILHVIRYGVPADIALNDIERIPTLVLSMLPGRAGESCSQLALDKSEDIFEELVRCFSRQRWEALKARFSPPDTQTVIMRTLSMLDPKGNFSSVLKLQLFLMQQLDAGDISIPALLQACVIHCDRLNWVMGRKRPLSHPRYRVSLLVLLAVLLATDPGKVRDISLRRLKEYCRILASRGFLTPGISTLEEIMGNIVLPFKAVHEGTDLFEAWMALPTQIYGLIKSRLKVWELNPKVTFGYQQGILQLEKEFCQSGQCRNCPLINAEVFIA